MPATALPPKWPSASAAADRTAHSLKTALATAAILLRCRALYALEDIFLLPARCATSTPHVPVASWPPASAGPSQTARRGGGHAANHLPARPAAPSRWVATGPTGFRSGFPESRLAPLL